MGTFKELGLSDEVLKALTSLGFETPSEIQEQAIPQLIKEDKDFIGLAQTGTGKTAAFGLPLLERIDPSNNSTQALVLAPTRELGQQIAEQIALYSKFQDRINVLAVYGGASISDQMRSLKKPQHIIIATPGRLIDLIGRKAIKLEKLQFLVLDEADEMLNMGFKEDIDEILRYTPEDKLTWLFSATMPAEIKRIVAKYMDNPIEVKVNTKNEVNTNIEHQYTTVRMSDKSEALKRILDVNPDMRGVVFCRTRRDTQDLADQLLQRNYKADALHGELSQQQRDRVMKRFKSHDLQVLIATDVAARGIDVNDLTHVFHYTLPDDNSYYTHRSGRTARAGKKGISIAFVNGKEGYKINRLEKNLGIKFEKITIPSAGDIATVRIQKWCESILALEPKGIDSDIILKVNNMFGNLTKEELAAKFVSVELAKLNSGTAKDLNDNSKGRDNDRDRDRGGRDRDRGGRDRGGRDRDRGGRDKDRGGRDRNSGGRDRDRGSRERGDGNETRSRDRGDRGEKKERAPRERKSNDTDGNPRYFINVGDRDKMSKSELKDFIATVTKIKKSDIGDVDVQKSFSFFEVDKNAEKKIGNKFDGYTLEDGRELRVNRDN